MTPERELCDAAAALLTAMHERSKPDQLDDLSTADVFSERMRLRAAINAVQEAMYGSREQADPTP